MFRTILAAAVVIALAGALGGCSVFQIQDSYGNRYGGWYEHGDQYRYQLALCEQQTAAASSILVALRPAYMRECMAQHGVPTGNITPAVGT